MKWISVIVLLLFLATWQGQRLTAIRRSGLPQAYAGYTADAPITLTFVMAGLGGFRGIVSEVLWFRANRLQEEGRYLELVQLADWLSMLDPHASEAWIYNAWNLTYNVSVMMLRDEDRLRWVQHGITLLRDEALRFNSRDARLYRELAWFYQNKIGDTLDNAHLTYKFDLATTMLPCVNPNGTVKVTPDTRARLAALRLDVDRMTELETRFGSLDWRLATSHALYWASQGLTYATGYEQYMCRRAVYQPLLLSVFNGRFTGDITQKQWQTTSNPSLALTTAEFIAETSRLFPSKPMTSMHIRYLCTSIYLLNKEKCFDLTRELYHCLLKVLPPDVNKPSIEEVINGWNKHDS